MYYSRLCLFPPEYQSSIPQIRKKIFCSFYALSLRKRNIDERKVMQFNGNNDQNRMKFSSAEFAKRFLADKCCASETVFRVQILHGFQIVITNYIHCLFLLRREVVYHTTPYLSSHPPGQSELSVGNASAPHSYRSQAVCDFLWRIPSADTSLSERNSEMIGVYYQRLTHESLRIGSTNSINGSTFRTEMTGIILFFTGFRCRISYFS
nr:hypothetical protein [Alistipes onderdonkii]